MEMETTLTRNVIMDHVCKSEYRHLPLLSPPNAVIAFLLFINILTIFLLFLRSVGLKPNFLYVTVLIFATNPHYFIMVIRTPVIGIGISNYSIARIGSLGFQIPLWCTSNCVIVWFTNLPQYFPYCYLCW